MQRGRTAAPGWERTSSPYARTECGQSDRDTARRSLASIVPGMSNAVTRPPSNSPQNRWVIPVGAVLVHVCIGSVYAWSTFNRPIQALFPESPWWFSPPYTTFTTALALLGLSAAFGGPWVERRGPRVAATAAALFFGTGLVIGGARTDAAPVGARLPRHGHRGRHRLRPRLHLAGEHAREVVSRPARDGHRAWPSWGSAAAPSSPATSTWR